MLPFAEFLDAAGEDLGNRGVNEVQLLLRRHAPQYAPSAPIGSRTLFTMFVMPNPMRADERFETVTCPNCGKVLTIRFVLADLRHDRELPPGTWKGPSSFLCGCRALLHLETMQTTAGDLYVAVGRMKRTEEPPEVPR